MKRFALLAVLLAPLAAAASASLGTPQAPGPTQNIGTDGGVGGVLSFPPGACLRITTQGTWGFNIQPLVDGGSTPDGGGFPLLPDAGVAANWATCSLQSYDWPDGGAMNWNPWNYLIDSSEEVFCLNGSAGGYGTVTLSTLYACSIDGGVLSVSARFAP